MNSGSIILKSLIAFSHPVTNWNCSALLEDVGKPTAIEPSRGVVALADRQQTFFKGVSITPAEVKQDKPDD